MAETVYTVEALSIKQVDGSDPTHYAAYVVESRLNDEGKILTTKQYHVKQPIPVAEFKKTLRFQPAKLIEMWQAEQKGKPAKAEPEAELGEPVEVETLKRGPGRPPKEG